MEDPPWIEATATVEACELIKHAPRIRTGRIANFEMPDFSRYAVTFTYHANGQLHSGQYIAHADVPLGHTFIISYDPHNPNDNSGSEDDLTFHPFRRRLIIGAALILILLASHWFRHR
ncbi:hypothetical protein RBB75_14940 [Tunturibacter empetritectus]|uniref:DUF3592 domain-containing protein n=1 Tax=Tunturiibacter empetritectus TaxID=3069691 RepID=A0AAU7ZAG6_9BACT